MTDIEQRVAAAIRAASDANLLPRKDMVIIDPAAESARVLLDAFAADGLVVVPRYTVDPFGIWQGECGHLWRKADSEHCPACATIDAMRPVVDAAVEVWDSPGGVSDEYPEDLVAALVRLDKAVSTYLKEKDDD